MVSTLEEPLDLVISDIKELVANNKLPEALDFCRQYFSPISSDLETSIIQMNANFHEIQRDQINGISHGYGSPYAPLTNRISNMINQLLPREIKSLRIMNRLKPSIYANSTKAELERIMGPSSNFLKINWLQKGIHFSKSVCQVQVGDGSKGTGFILKGGYLMTNYHLIHSKECASTCKIVFNYEEDLFGKMKKTSEYKLDPGDARFSPVDDLDYAYIKIVDDSAHTLDQWGYLELENAKVPEVNEAVTIIQHPYGGSKSIALTANQIIGLKGNKVFYLTDTERGSSGSPVFNNDWKVIALHHASIEEESGVIVNSLSNEKRAANLGILIKDIMESLAI